MYVQYIKWVSGFVRGDFGRSFQYNREVSDLIWERLGLYGPYCHLYLNFYLGGGYPHRDLFGHPSI